MKKRIIRRFDVTRNDLYVYNCGVVCSSSRYTGDPKWDTHFFFLLVNRP
jgi:hypothetical protein